MPRGARRRSETYELVFFKKSLLFGNEMFKDFVSGNQRIFKDLASSIKLFLLLCIKTLIFTPILFLDIAIGAFKDAKAYVIR